MLDAFLWAYLAVLAAAVVSYILARLVAPGSARAFAVFGVFALLMVGGVQAYATVKQTHASNPEAETASSSPPAPLASRTQRATVSPSEKPRRTGTPLEEPSKASLKARISRSPKPESTTYYLSQLDYVHAEKEGRTGSCTDGCTGFEDGSGRIGGDVFPNSWIMWIDGDGRRGTTDWNAARSCSRFQATVGLDDSSPSTSVTFSISRDGGEPHVMAVTTLARPVRVEANLRGAATFTIAAYVSGRPVDDLAVDWGDARLTCRSGSLDVVE